MPTCRGSRRQRCSRSSAVSARMAGTAGVRSHWTARAAQLASLGKFLTPPLPEAGREEEGEWAEVRQSTHSGYGRIRAQRARPSQSKAGRAESECSEHGQAGIRGTRAHLRRAG
eukprot:2258452-Prymnesium_polylepis.1